MTLKLTVPLLFAGAAGVFVAHGIWFLAVPFLLLATFTQAEVVK